MAADFAAAIAQDYKCIDGHETITHTNKTASATNTDSVAYAVRYDITRREVQASEGAYTSKDAIWELPATLCAYEPKEGDTITGADARVWSILEVARQNWDTIYRCVCRLQRG